VHLVIEISSKNKDQERFSVSSNLIWLIQENFN